MIRIPCVEEGEKVPVFATLLELLFGYAYDQRTTQVCYYLILLERPYWYVRHFQPVGSICFWASWIRIRILPTTCKKRRNLDFCCSVTSLT